MRRSSLLVVTLLLLIGGGLVVWHYQSRADGGMSPPESGVYLVLRPLQRGLMTSGGWAMDVARAALRRGDIVSENKSLTRKVAFLETERQRLLDYRRRNEELRSLLQMPELSGGRKITADVVALSGTDASLHIVLNTGTQSGVRAKDVVYTDQGLVGQIETVSMLSSTAILLTDRQLSGVGAMTSRTRATGVVVGNGGRACELRYLPFDADVREGDLVVTSGKSDIYPQGLAIGRVTKVERNKTYSRLTAEIEPAVPLDRINAVNIRVGAGA